MIHQHIGLIRNKDFERYFDSTPGPGSYNLAQKLQEKVNKLLNSTQPDTSATNFESPRMSSHTSPTDNKTNRSSFLNKRSVFIPKSNGTFTTGKRSEHRIIPGPGPGQYDVTKLEHESKHQRVKVPNFKDKRPALKLPFSLSNPLNYVNSYTVNVYYKPGHPGVGTYNLDAPIKHNMNPTFNSGVQRKLPFEEQQRFDLPIQYNSEGTFKFKSYGVNNSSGMCQPTHRKLVKLALFGKDSISKNKKIIGQSDIFKLDSSELNTGPHTTKVSDHDLRSDLFTQDSSYYDDTYKYGFGKPVKYSPKDNLMGDLNRDRFGNPLEPKTNTFEIPGPGSYHPDKLHTVKLGVFQGIF